MESEKEINVLSNRAENPIYWFLNLCQSSSQPNWLWEQLVWSTTTQSYCKKGLCLGEQTIFTTIRPNRGSYKLVLKWNQIPFERDKYSSLYKM